MSAHIERKREKTAKEIAKIEGISERTVRKYIAQKREDYELEAKQKRHRVFSLRSSGMKWKEVAEAMDTTVNAVNALYQRYLKIDLEKETEH